RGRLTINMHDILRADLTPHIDGKLIEKQHRLLPALLRSLWFGIVLVAADNEAIRKIREELEPFGLDLAVGERIILPEGPRISLDFHVEVRMRRKQAAAKIGRSKTCIVRPRVS